MAVFFCAISASAMAPHPPHDSKPWAMAILGDSIAAGSLADFPIPLRDTPEERVLAWKNQGLEAEFLYTNKRKLSWGSGTAIQSHYVLLQNWLQKSGDGRPLSVINVAHPGAVAGDLTRQIQGLLAELHRHSYEGLKYVAVTIGSNDACEWSDPGLVDIESLRRHFLEGFRLLSSSVLEQFTQSEPVSILIVGLPRIPNLGAETFVHAPTLFGLSCGKVRDEILKYCRPLTVWKTEEEYLKRLAVVETVNQALASVALELRSEYSNLDVFYSDHLFQLEIPISDLAVDCFHPAKRAQEKISLQTWRDQPWFH